MGTDDTKLSYKTAVAHFLILAVLCACSTPGPTTTPLALLLRLPTPISGGNPAPTPPPPPRFAVLEHTEQSDIATETTTLTTPSTPQLSATPLLTAEHVTDLAPVLDPIIQRAIDEFDLVGLTVGVRHGETGLFIRAYGLGDIAAATTTNPFAPYPIASITKQFTAAAVMQLVEAGAINLDDSIAASIPESPDAWQSITVRHLLNHTSGLVDLDAAALSSLNKYDRYEVADVVALIHGWAPEPAFSPGSSFSYSSVGYYLLGVIIERVSGMTYGEYLGQHLFDPLGLSDTGYALTYPPNLPRGYTMENGALQPVRPVHPSLTYSASGIVSTARDLLTWQEVLAHGRVVGSDAYRQMVKPTALTSGAEVPYGFGLGVGRSACSNSIDHSGRILGYESHLAYCPDNELGLVLLLNSNPADSGAAEYLAGRLISALLNHAQ